jgi:hypothetical protein
MGKGIEEDVTVGVTRTSGREVAVFTANRSLGSIPVH